MHVVHLTNVLVSIAMTTTGSCARDFTGWSKNNFKKNSSSYSHSDTGSRSEMAPLKTRRKKKGCRQDKKDHRHFDGRKADARVD